MSKNIGGGRSVATGRFMGRFEYELLDPKADPLFNRYTVFRTSDNRYLGQVRRRIGTARWMGGVAGLAGWSDVMHTRREWAADWLDGQALLDEWCECGVSVGLHDRPTRAACRAWAEITEIYVEGSRAKLDAWQAAYHARPRGRHYDVSTAMSHAAAWATPPPAGQLHMVKPDTDLGVRVRAAPDGRLTVAGRRGVVVGEPYQWPGERDTLASVRDHFETVGYAVSYRY